MPIKRVKRPIFFSDLKDKRRQKKRNSENPAKMMYSFGEIRNKQRFFAIAVCEGASRIDTKFKLSMFTSQY